MIQRAVIIPAMRSIEMTLGKDFDRSSSNLPKKTIICSDSTFAEGTTMTFHNISYCMELKTGYFGMRETVRKEILKNISGVMKPGLNAILGPTGCGKSSLLDILATRKDPKGLSGEILVNGYPQPPHFKCMSGYVVQEDIVMGTLTVRENLEFSAALRLPSSMSSEEKLERVNVIIRDLDLSKVADSKIGTQFIRGVSGGEKKRTSIGLELITNPTVLFLDEPTTGLDASTANAVLLLLKTMAQKGKTIIFSIHQPRYSIFKLFDSLTLLAAGRVVYHGPASNTIAYFRSLGYVCEPYNNPADFVLDIINGDSTAVTSKADLNDPEVIEIVESDRVNETIATRLAEQFCKTAAYKNMKAHLEAVSAENKNRRIIYRAIPYTTPFFHQLKWVSRRTFKNLIGNPQSSTAQICITTVLGLIVGAIFSGVKNDASGIQNRAGALFFLTANQCMNSVTTVELFITEKRIFMHEYISGYYRVSAYFFSKIIADLIPMRTLLSVIITCLNYFTIGFKPTVEAFFIMMITVTLVSYTASSMCLAIATGQDVTSVANLLINICFVFMLIFSGLLVNLPTISPWLLWLEYFSIPRYGLNALQINEFTGLRFCETSAKGTNTTCITPSPFTICTGEEYLKIQGINISTRGMLQNYVALLSMTIAFLTIAYLKLRFLKKFT
ncbi:broad substrate specificity ATP-binding cassette transporter ABCG2-like isoform X2 [Hemicordylus capensis]|uniref:broad substrate specificity ATP-binding cassette transporter ABCG2-like isoform X2 n=1 Tax=Hemicordylus capensis TaxID=884348 RepID=UPI0023021623|nr:broad substrate specificity ATP-binding cassette transporter ABCG2-like isoform X2 [Hemicordylus capensis]